MQQHETCVSDYMTKTHNYVKPSASLRDALEAMDKSHTHYLPVLSKGKVIGILKDNLSRSAAMVFDPTVLKVADLMSKKVSVVPPETSLHEVLDSTPDNTYGCTVVQNSRGKIVGIFTPKEAMNSIHLLAKKRDVQ